MNRRKSSIPILEFFELIRESKDLSRQELAQKMSEDWGDDYSKQDLDALFEASTCPKAITLARICWSLDLKIIPHPDRFKNNGGE